MYLEFFPNCSQRKYTKLKNDVLDISAPMEMLERKALKLFEELQQHCLRQHPCTQRKTSTTLAPAAKVR